MFNYKYFSIALFFLFLYACNTENNESTDKNALKKEAITSKDQIYGTWKISEVDSIFDAKNKDAKLRSKIKSQGHLYSFFSDQTGSIVEGKKYQGTKWKLDGSTIHLTRIQEGLNKMEEIKLKNIQCYTKVKHPFFSAEIEGLGMFQFRQLTAPISNINEDPYHPINNQWRVTASKSETYKQMRQRLYNFTQHCHFLFKSALERGQNKVFSGNTASIYKYYDGAIALVDGGKVPSAWISNFYSPDEAMDTWSMAKKYFKNNMIRKTSNGGYVVANEAIFRDLLSKMEKDL